MLSFSEKITIAGIVICAIAPLFSQLVACLFNQDSRRTIYLRTFVILGGILVCFLGYRDPNPIYVIIFALFIGLMFLESRYLEAMPCNDCDQ
jgi:hypothetical protein